MDRRRTVALGLAFVGIALVAVPFVAPADPVRVHDTDSMGPDNVSRQVAFAESLFGNATVVRYENLSPRAKEVYDAARTSSNGVHRVPVGEGAPEFDYTDRLRGRTLEIDGTTSPPDERVPHAYVVVHSNASASAPNYRDGGVDLLVTTTGTPPLGSGAHVPRLAAFVLGAFSLAGAGYLFVNGDA